VAHRTGLEDAERGESYPNQDLNPDRSVVEPVTSHYTDYAFPATVYYSIRFIIIIIIIIITLAYYTCIYHVMGHVYSKCMI
jgi:hypothetical protein